MISLLPASECQWDLVSLGEVMLRLDPGDGRISTTRTFQAWEGGGEYNVARGLKRCFGLRTAHVTQFADNPVGDLLRDLIYQGGVDQSLMKWVPFDGIGRDVRNGLNFTERGFGVRAALGCSDRGHSAASQMQPGEVDWDDIFGKRKSRWFHTGGIFAALSDSTPQVAIEAMHAAKAGGAMISYDLNYRPSLWKSIGGQKRAQEVNRELAKYVDVMIGNEEDFTASLGYEVEGAGADHSNLAIESFRKMIDRYRQDFPNTSVVATTLRTAKTASRNDWSAICVADGQLYEAPKWTDLEIFDRVGGGDSFASGLIFGLMKCKDPLWAVTCGAAHGALAMTTPGDTTMVTLGEVERAMKQGTARIER